MIEDILAHEEVNRLTIRLLAGGLYECDLDLEGGFVFGQGSTVDAAIDAAESKLSDWLKDRRDYIEPSLSAWERNNG